MVPTSTLKNLKKNPEKWPFQTLKTFVFWVQGQFKNIFLGAYYDQIFILLVLNVLLYFPGKWFQLHHLKSCKELNNALFKRSEHSVFSWKYLSNHFLRSFLWPNFDLNSFERFALLSQKMVSTSSLKNLQTAE